MNRTAWVDGVRVVLTPAALLGQGGEAEVYDLADGRVLISGGFERAAAGTCPSSAATGATCYDLTATRTASWSTASLRRPRTTPGRAAGSAWPEAARRCTWTASTR